MRLAPCGASVAGENVVIVNGISSNAAVSTGVYKFSRIPNRKQSAIITPISSLNVGMSVRGNRTHSSLEEALELVANSRQRRLCCVVVEIL